MPIQDYIEIRRQMYSGFFCIFLGVFFVFGTCAYLTMCFGVMKSDREDIAEYYARLPASRQQLIGVISENYYFTLADNRKVITKFQDYLGEETMQDIRHRKTRDEYYTNIPSSNHQFDMEVEKKIRDAIDELRLTDEELQDLAYCVETARNIGSRRYEDEQV
jgi:hypothetical protein